MAGHECDDPLGLDSQTMRELGYRTVVVREGERCDRFYVVVEGELEVEAGGRELRRLGRGEGFGELALLRDVLRTATVTALGETRLFALDKATFLAGIGSHPRAAGEAERLVRERLPSQQATDSLIRARPR
jgi:CRP-like cAMP-binding protein